MKAISQYDQQAIDFLKKTNVEFQCKFLKNGLHFDDDKTPRDIYKITLKRDKYAIRFKFGQSIINSGVIKKEPTPYDVLACLQKYDVGSFEDFCSEFGYDTDSRKAEKTYKAVCDEYLKVCSIFSDEELIELQEIN